MASSAPTRSRLDPEVFRLPVERIRDGYYTDAYFNFTRQLLVGPGHRPPVTVQVFQKQHSVLGGIDEAIAVLKLCSDDWSGLEVHALHEGDEIEPWEPVLQIDGDYALFAHLETVYLGVLSRRTRIMRNVRRWSTRPTGSRSCSSPRATTTGSCRRATAGRRTWPARSASPRTRRPPGGAAAASGRCRTA